MPETRNPYFLTPLPYLCCARDTVVTHFQRPYLFIFYARDTLVSPTAPTLHTSASFPPPLLYIRCARDTVASNSYLCYLIHAIPETRWSLIPIALPYIRYARDMVVSDSNHHCLLYAVPETRWCLTPIAPSLYMLCLRRGGLKFPLPLPDTCIYTPIQRVVSHFQRPNLLYVMPKTQLSLIPAALS